MQQKKRGVPQGTLCSPANEKQSQLLVMDTENKCTWGRYLKQKTVMIQ